MFKGLTKKPLHDLMRAAHKLGAVGTFVADTAVYGSRPKPDRSASIAAPRRTARDSIGKHSVWEGPTRIPGGAPVLRRNKVA